MLASFISSDTLTLLHFNAPNPEVSAFSLVPPEQDRSSPLKSINSKLAR